MEKRDRSSGPTNPHLRLSPGAKRLTLREALHYLGDSEEVAEMLELKAAGFGGPIMLSLGGPETEYERKVGRYERLHQNAKDSLRSKLVSGEIAATGRDARDRIDSPRVAVPAELWQTLEFDFDNSSASGHGLLIIHILVSVVGGLRLWKASRRARLGDVELALTPQSHSLLVALAERALDGAAPFEGRKLEAQFFPHREDPKALGQAIGTLRKQLVASRLDKKVVALMIRSVRGVGYVLDMPATEITIVP